MTLSPLTEPIVIADERRPRFTPNIPRASTVATARHKLFVTASQRSSPGIGGHQGLDCGEHNRCSRGGIVPAPSKIKREVRRIPAEIHRTVATTSASSATRVGRGIGEGAFERRNLLCEAEPKDDRPSGRVRPTIRVCRMRWRRTQGPFCRREWSAYPPELPSGRFGAASFWAFARTGNGCAGGVCGAAPLGGVGGLERVS